MCCDILIYPECFLTEINDETPIVFVQNYSGVYDLFNGEQYCSMENSVRLDIRDKIGEEKKQMVNNFCKFRSLYILTAKYFTSLVAN